MMLIALFFCTCSILLDSDGHIKLTGEFLASCGCNIVGTENGWREGKRKGGRESREKGRKGEIENRWREGKGESQERETERGRERRESE